MRALRVRFVVRLEVSNPYNLNHSAISFRFLTSLSQCNGDGQSAGSITPPEEVMTSGPGTMYINRLRFALVHMCQVLGSRQILLFGDLPGVRSSPLATGVTLARTRLSVRNRHC